MQWITQVMGLSVIIRKATPILMVIALSACTQSMHKVSHTSPDASTLQKMSAKNDLSPLKQKSADELLTRGNLYLESRSFQLANLHFVAALEKDPGLAGAYIGLGQIDMQNGHYPAALDKFARASEINPNMLSALVGQARALRFSGKLSSATEKINAAMALAPNDLTVLTELAIIYDLMGSEALAETIHHEIVELSPDIASGHNNLGMNLMIRKLYPEAILSFLQALNIEQENPRVKNNLATAYALNGEEEKALRIFVRTVGEAAAYNNLGYIYTTQGRYDEAETFLRKAMATNPSFYQKAQDNLDQVNLMRKSSHQ